MRVFGLIGLLLTFAIGVVVAMKQMNKLAARPPGSGLGAPSLTLEAVDSNQIQGMQKLPAKIEKDLKKVVKQRQEIGD